MGTSGEKTEHEVNGKYESRSQNMQWSDACTILTLLTRVRTIEQATGRLTKITHNVPLCSSLYGVLCRLNINSAFVRQW